MPSIREISVHLDLSERQARDAMERYSINDWRSLELDKIRVAYIRGLRLVAAGRGGDYQANLAKARAEESEIRTATLRLDYNAKLGSLILADDAAKAISDWCRFANQEYRQGLQNIVAEIQNAYRMTVDVQLVDRIAEPTMERIKNYAGTLGRDLVMGADN
jgi:hypothetical protein